MIPLPPAFTQRIREQLGSQADAFFLAMEQPPTRGLRIHPQKTPELPLETYVEGLEDPIPWVPEGRYLSPESTAGVHPLHACGAYYLQEPSAMLPAHLLRPLPGEAVLDLCAAPGGKSTQLASFMRGQGTLVCNEFVPSRAETLSGNLERMGVSHAVVVSADPAQLAGRWPQLFDAVLVDAPCSGEGMFRRHPETRLEWDAEAPSRCAKRQLRILDSAAAMLKSGGRLCYSTCTFSEEENEGVIRAFLESHPEFHPVDFSVPIANNQTLYSANGCMRLHPHEVRGEGHFAALLQKSERCGTETQAALLPADRVFAPPDPQTLAAFHTLWQALSADVPPTANAMIGNLLIAAPPLPPLHGLKAYRAGISLGRLKGKVCIPDHALALAILPSKLRSLPLDAAAVADYLRGEVLPACAVAGGFWTVSFAGLPLGFVKHSDRQLKNHYPKGLRKR